MEQPHVSKLLQIKGNVFGGQWFKLESVNFDSLSLQVCGSNLIVEISILLKFSHKY
jgi:hypothetical protein